MAVANPFTRQNPGNPPSVWLNIAMVPIDHQKVKTFRVTYAGVIILSGFNVKEMLDYMCGGFDPFNENQAADFRKFCRNDRYKCESDGCPIPVGSVLEGAALTAILTARSFRAPIANAEERLHNVVVSNRGRGSNIMKRDQIRSRAVDEPRQNLHLLSNNSSQYYWIATNLRSLGDECMILCRRIVHDVSRNNAQVSAHMPVAFIMALLERYHSDLRNWALIKAGQNALIVGPNPTVCHPLYRQKMQEAFEQRQMKIQKAKRQGNNGDNDDQQQQHDDDDDSIYHRPVIMFLQPEGLRQSTSHTDTVEERGEIQSQADAAEQGPPAKKAKTMQTAALHHSTPKTVGQRIKETLQTSKSQLTRSPVSDATVLPSAAPSRLSPLQVNTIRIIGQYLKNLGLQETVATLFTESGCILEDSLAVRLREYVLNGEWDHALSIVDKMAPFASRKNLLKIREKLFEEKFVALLSKEKVFDALYLLTVDFPSDPIFFNRRDFLASLLYSDPKSIDLYRKTGAHRSRRDRSALVAEIQQLLPTSVMLPCNRLEKLLAQSWSIQCRECYIHMKDDIIMQPECILEDHQCDWDSFPIFTSQILNQHVDEVWNVAFSPCGKYLATGARTGPANIWKVVSAAKLELYKTLDGRTGSAAIVWSEDSELLAVCAADSHVNDIFIYDIHNGTIFSYIEGRGSDSIVFSFFPDSYPYKLVFADQAGQFCQFLLRQNTARLDGKFEGYRIRALKCLKDGSVLAADTHNRVRSYRFVEDTEMTLIEELSQIVSFVVDKSEQRILIDTKLHGLRLWDLPSRTLLRSYIGASHQDFIIHSTFGGPYQSYIATGSIDENVYIWKQNSDQLVAKLSGHTARVNAVTWNPELPQLVSCADDCTVRVWSPLAGFDPSGAQRPS